MRIGTAERDITPDVGVELSGYLFRVQPSLGVHDPLLVRAMFICDEHGRRLLWLQADVIGFDAEFVAGFRAWAQRKLDLRPSEVVLAATHTHAGPATVPLILCGEMDRPYLERVRRELELASEAAVGESEPATLLAAEGRCELSRERRKTASPHSDPRVGTLAWRRDDGTFIAVLSTYAVHNVALSHENRFISGDLFGAASRALSQRLPGRPTALFAAGAAGNVNPPHLGTDFATVDRWGGMLADAVVGALRGAREVSFPALRTASTTIPLPFERLGEEQIEAIARAAREALINDGSYGPSRYHCAVTTWRERMLDRLHRDALPRSVSLELCGLRFGTDVELLCANAELFSRFGDDLRSLTGRQRTYVVGYANGVIGYVPTTEALAEGGYESASAFIFYDGLPLCPGAHDKALRSAAGLLESLAVQPQT